MRVLAHKWRWSNALFDIFSHFLLFSRPVLALMRTDDAVDVGSCNRSGSVGATIIRSVAEHRRVHELAVDIATSARVGAQLGAHILVGQSGAA
jgi:hypothetical protein